MRTRSVNDIFPKGQLIERERICCSRNKRGAPKKEDTESRSEKSTLPFDRETRGQERKLRREPGRKRTLKPPRKQAPPHDTGPRPALFPYRLNLLGKKERRKKSKGEQRKKKGKRLLKKRASLPFEKGLFKKKIQKSFNFLASRFFCEPAAAAVAKVFVRCRVSSLSFIKKKVKGGNVTP
jgi:hypothetical protein